MTRQDWASAKAIGAGLIATGSAALSAGVTEGVATLWTTATGAGLSSAGGVLASFTNAESGFMGAWGAPTGVGYRVTLTRPSTATDCAALAATAGSSPASSVFAGSLEAAVPLAYAAARAAAAPVVLLSPAAASFDQFVSFEARGDCFAAGVAALLREAA